MSTGEKDAAFDRVYAELFRDVFSYFNVCFGAEAAEDLAQEVFLRVWKTLDGGKIPDSWRAWVFRCAVNLKNDFLRQKYAGEKSKSSAEQFLPAQSAADENSGAHIGIQLALARLPDADRELLTLKSFGFTSEEIGEFLKISASAVRTRLQKAKQSFKISLEKEGVTDV